LGAAAAAAVKKNKIVQEMSQTVFVVKWEEGSVGVEVVVVAIEGKERKRKEGLVKEEELTLL
jgi:hypothetical protein